MDWAHHEPQFRFDIRAEREECERLSLHQAKVLQDRMVRRSRTGRTKHPATPEWENSRTGTQIAAPGKSSELGQEKRYYFANKNSA